VVPRLISHMPLPFQAQATSVDNEDGRKDQGGEVREHDQASHHTETYLEILCSAQLQMGSTAKVITVR